MTPRIGISSLLLALLGAAPDLPEGFWRLPASVRANATAVVAGTYTVGRGPCEWLPDGSRRWRRLEGFTIEAVYRGDVKTRYIGVEPPMTWPNHLAPVQGRKYLLLLRPSKDSAKALRNAEGTALDQGSLTSAEILAVAEP